MDLRQLIDRAEIADAITRYTLAIDEGDFERLDAVFTPDAHIDYTESGGVADVFPVVKAWLAEALPGFSTHRVHMLGQVAFAFADGGDEAAVTAYFHNPMRVADGRGGERVVEVGGMYQHTFVRTGEGWRSRLLHEKVVWTRGF